MGQKTGSLKIQVKLTNFYRNKRKKLLKDRHKDQWNAEAVTVNGLT